MNQQFNEKLGLLETYIKGYNEANKPFLVHELKYSKSNTEGDLEEMKNIRRRKNGLWEARIHKDGISKSFYAQTQKECKAKLIAFKKSLKKEPEKPHSITFYKFALFWFDTYKKSKVSQKTQKIYKNLIEQHLKKVQIELRNLTITDLQLFLNTYPSKRTKEQLYIMIKAIIKKAYMLDHIKKDLSIGLEKGAIERKLVNAYSIQEQKLILDNLGTDKFSTLILTYLLTGIRKNEALTITHEDIKGEFLFVKGTKTDRAVRYIKISEKLKNRLNAIESNPLFDFDTECMKTKTRRFGAKIGISPFGFHRLRHTFASNLYYLGVRDKERQEYMGHASSILTNDVYTHLDPTIKKEDIEKLYKDLYPTF